MPFREPPDLDRVDTDFVSGAGTPASEIVRRQKQSPGTSSEKNENPSPRTKPDGKGSPEKKATAKKATARKATEKSPKRTARTSAESGRPRSESIPRPEAPAPEPTESTDDGSRTRTTAEGGRAAKRATAPGLRAGDDSRYVEPDARMLVNVRMPVALHERLKAASEHTSLTITDIVLRGTETELEAVEQRYREITGESIPVQRRKVRID